MNSSEWLKLNLPELKDPADILKLSQNFEWLDKFLKEFSTNNSEMKKEISDMRKEILSLKNQRAEDVRDTTIAINSIKDSLSSLALRVAKLEEGGGQKVDENYIYWGNSKNAVPSAVIVQNLANILWTEQPYRDINVTMNEEYCYYALPVRFGQVRFEVSGFTGGFEEPVVLPLSSSNHEAEDYYVYRSVRVLNGSVTIKVKA